MLQGCNAKAHSKCQPKLPPRCGTEYTPPPFYQPTPSSSTYVSAPVQTAQSPAPAPLKKSPSKPNLAAKAAPQSTSSYVGTAKVLYEYVAANPAELTVKEGDIVYVLEFDDGNGWMRAEVRGKKGVIPANYAQAQFKPSPVPKGGLAVRSKFCSISFPKQRLWLNCFSFFLSFFLSPFYFLQIHQ